MLFVCICYFLRVWMILGSQCQSRSVWELCTHIEHIQYIFHTHLYACPFAKLFAWSRQISTTYRVLRSRHIEYLQTDCWNVLFPCNQPVFVCHLHIAWRCDLTITRSSMEYSIRNPTWTSTWASVFQQWRVSETIKIILLSKWFDLKGNSCNNGVTV